MEKVLLAGEGADGEGEGGGSRARIIEAGGLRVAIEGCCHGTLDEIYRAIEETQANNGYKVDLLLICGDFQACRNEQDLECMAVPQKYRTMASFWKYYTGHEGVVAPILTVFVGGNHEASNHLWELFHGGWVAPNIYYLGHSGVVNVGGLRIAGLSGIFKDGHYKQGHWEHPPYDDSSMRSAYHVREFDVWRLMLLSGTLDVMLTHDWPRGVHRYGNERSLLSRKRFLEKEVQTNTLGNPHTPPVMSHLKPHYWFSAHLHTKFAALVPHEGEGGRRTKFLSLDKCLPQRDFLQIVTFPEASVGPERVRLEYDMEWLAILRATQPYLSLDRRPAPLPPPASLRARVEEELEWIKARVNADDKWLMVPENFEVTVERHRPGVRMPRQQPPFAPSPQTRALTSKLEVPMPHERIGGGGNAAGGGMPMPILVQEANPDEIDLDDSDDPDVTEAAGSCVAAPKNDEEIDIDDD